MKRRIRNDYQFAWHITRGKKPEDFSGKPLSVQLIDALGRKSDISYTIEGNTVTVTFLGRDQHRLGKYNAVLCVYPDEPGMATINHQEVVELVANTEEEDNIVAENVEIISDEISGDFSVPQRGLSAYEIAVANGFVGTVNEWLASLKGEPGDRGHDGYPMWPTMEVTKGMHLIAHCDAATNKLRVVKGRLILDFN